MQKLFTPIENECLSFLHKISFNIHSCAINQSPTTSRSFYILIIALIICHILITHLQIFTTYLPHTYHTSYTVKRGQWHQEFFHVTRKINIQTTHTLCLYWSFKPKNEFECCCILLFDYMHNFFPHFIVF